MPQRIQLRRVKGWRLPREAVVVSRPGRWGNPYRWEDQPDVHISADDPAPLLWDSLSAYVASVKRLAAVDAFRRLVDHPDPDGRKGYPTVGEIRAALAGRDLACWCPPGHPCHADVLLEIANTTEVA